MNRTVSRCSMDYRWYSFNDCRYLLPVQPGCRTVDAVFVYWDCYADFRYHGYRNFCKMQRADVWRGLVPGRRYPDGAARPVLLFNQAFTMLSLPFIFGMWLLFSGINQFVNSFELQSLVSKDGAG